MRIRVQSVLQAVVALLCAMGAGFSGDLYSNHSSASHHNSRQSRGSHPRGNRGVSRSGYEDHSADVEILKTDHAHAPPGSDAAVAVTPATFVPPTWVELGVVVPLQVFTFSSAILPEWAPRGPPVLS